MGQSTGKPSYEFDPQMEEWMGLREGRRYFECLIAVPDNSDESRLKAAATLQVAAGNAAASKKVRFREPIVAGPFFKLVSPKDGKPAWYYAVLCEVAYNVIL